MSNSLVHSLSLWFWKLLPFPSHPSPPQTKDLFVSPYQYSSLAWLCCFWDVVSEMFPELYIKVWVHCSFVQWWNDTLYHAPTLLLMPNLLHSFVCHCSESWWLQRTVNDDSKNLSPALHLSVLSSVSHRQLQLFFYIYLYLYGSSFANLFTIYLVLWRHSVHPHQFDATSGNSRENSMTGKLGDLTAHSFFQTTNDFWTDCSFFDRIYPSTSPWKIMLPALPHVEKPWLCLTLWLLDPSIRFQSTKETPPQINVEEITVVGFLSGEAMMTLSQYILMFKTACSEIFLSEIGFHRNWSQTQWYAFSRIPCTAIFLNIGKKTEP